MWPLLFSFSAVLASVEEKKLELEKETMEHITIQEEKKLQHEDKKLEWEKIKWEREQDTKMRFQKLELFQTVMEKGRTMAEMEAFLRLLN